MATAAGIPIPGKDSLDLRLASGLLWLLALLQALGFAGGEAGRSAAFGAGLALASTLVLWRVRPPGRCLVAQALLAAMAVANLVAAPALAQGEHLVPALLRGVGYGYAGITLVGLAALVWRSAATGLLLTAALAACGLAVIDGDLLHSKAVLRDGDHPRGDAKAGDARSARWSLSTAGGSRAGLVFPAGQADDRVRVTVERLGGLAPWQVQLAFGGIQVRQGEELLLALRLKADQPRSLGLGLSQDHAPWRDLGLYRTVEAGPEWRDLVIPLTVRDADDRARLIFDLGLSTTAVEIESVVLRRRATSDSVVRPVPGA